MLKSNHGWFSQLPVQNKGNLIGQSNIQHGMLKAPVWIFFPYLSVHSPYLSLHMQNSLRCREFSPTLSTQKLLTLCFYHQQNIHSLQNDKRSLCSPILSPFILLPLSTFEPPGFLPLQHRNPFHHHGNHTSNYFSCTHEASSLPSVFSLLYHQESIWIHGGLQGTEHCPKLIWSLWVRAM